MARIAEVMREIRGWILLKRSRPRPLWGSVVGGSGNRG